MIERSEPPASMQEQEGDSTTLKQCGWCAFASGLHHFSYCISGKCQLGMLYDKDVTWETKCRLISASKADLAALILHHEYRIEESKNSIKRQKGMITEIQKLVAAAPDRPVLPQDRPPDHFNIDDRVMVYMEDVWVGGDVRQGYRHHDGCVSYRLDDRGPQDTDKDGFWGSGYAVPTVILETEAKQLVANLEEAKVWFDKACGKSFNGSHIDGNVICTALVRRTALIENATEG